MKKMLILLCMAALVFLLALAVYSNSTKQSPESESVKAELEQLKAALGKTESERDTIKAKIAAVEKNRDELAKQVNKLTESRDKLHKQVEKFTFLSDQSRQQLDEIIKTRDELKKQVAELSDTRDKQQRQVTELTASNNQLSKQVEKLTESRNEAFATAQTAPKQTEILAAAPDSEKQQLLERKDGPATANQIQDDTQPPMVEIREFPTARTEASRPVVITSQLEGRPTCHSFNTTRPRITPGQASTLSWQVSNADQIRIEPDIGPVSALGSVAVKPSTATTYTMFATNEEGESMMTCRIEVGDSPAIQKQESIRPAVFSDVVEPSVINKQLDGRPTCHSFDTTRPRITPGQSAMLSWQVSNADRIRIEPDIGPVSALGSVAVKPSMATTYTLIAANEAGENIQTCRVEVGKNLTTGSDKIRPRISFEQGPTSGDSKVLSHQKPPVSDPNATLGKFLGYRARKDESGKFIFIPVYENKQEK